VTPAIALAVFAAVAVTGAGARACGVCDEDKVAATYDHALVQRAAARKLLVVFCDVRGPSWDRAGAQTVARTVGGIDVDSVRASAQPATLSFVVDPRTRSAQRAVAAMQRGAPRGTRLSIVRVVAHS
jgi:hypothetical protein